MGHKWAVIDMSLGILDLIAVAITAAVIATVGIGVSYIASRRPQRLRREISRDDIAFLLDGEEIIDSTGDAAVLLSQAGISAQHRDSIIAVLAPTFGDLRQTLDECGIDPVVLTANDGSSSWLNIVRAGHSVRISVGRHSDANIAQINALTLAKENTELSVLRDVVKNAPTMMWRCNAKGQLLWANDACFDVADACASAEIAPARLSNAPLFNDFDDTIGLESAQTRKSLQTAEQDTPRWYDITTYKSETGAFHYATDADSVVRAELAQRDFVQTLSQTFAQLSIGLAIFDRRRQLATFNPALLDMTGLNFEFLSGRPTLDAVLDRLRESRMLPEPKNYTSWREQFSAMEHAAKNGTYSEHWNLPDGQTFRVTGRPHPDGAFALFFEDISAEISLTRRFRSEIETGQAVLDHIEDAVVVFSNAGNLVMANAAYSALWGTDLADGITHYDLRVELRKWQSRCTPSRIWTNLREFSSHMGLRQPWTDTAIMDDGRHITCQADPIAGGMTLIRFKFDRPPKPTIQKLTQIDPALLAAKR